MTTPTRQERPVLVLGGTGKTGRRVASRLTELGIPVRIGSRSGYPPFDWDDRSTWEPVLKDVASVYVVYSPDAGFPEAAERIEAFAKLAVRTGVRRLVLLSGRGEAGALRSEAAIQVPGAAWTVVRSSFFAQNFSEDFLAYGIHDGAVAFPADGVAEPFIDAGDIADVAVAALTRDDHAGQIYEVTGPRLLTFAGAIGELAGAIGRNIQYVPVTGSEFESGMIDAGLPAEFASQLTALFTEVLDGRNSKLSDGVKQVLGREPRDFADYAHEVSANGV